MKIESDRVEITSGVRHGLTMGGPITLNVTNLDHQKWLEIMSVSDVEDKKKGLRKITKPRPGHADLVGGIKYRFDDLRNSLERSSARETTMRVAVGAVAKRFIGRDWGSSSQPHRQFRWHRSRGSGNLTVPKSRKRLLSQKFPSSIESEKRKSRPISIV